jgi:hypothetical protein
VGRNIQVPAIVFFCFLHFHKVNVLA